MVVVEILSHHDCFIMC